MMVENDNAWGIIAALGAALLGVGLAVSLFRPKCPRCQGRVQNAAPYCPSCGVSLAWPSP